MATARADRPDVSKRYELVAAIILGLAATLTALAAFLGSAAGGEASTLRADAGRTLADANFFFQEDTQLRAVDQGLFVEYATASFQEDFTRAEYLTTLMRPELQAAVEWWTATDDAVTPFDEVDGNPYFAEGAQASLEAASGLQEEADRQVLAANEEDERASRFELATVLLAVSLFFGGIATLFQRERLVQGMLAIGAVVLVAGATVLGTGL